MTTLLYWLYQWQNKEYRRDRMLTFLRKLDRATFLRLYFIGEPRRPRITFRILLIVLITMNLFVINLLFLLSIYIDWPIALIIAYSTIPLLVTVAVSLSAIPYHLMVEVLGYLALSKRSQFKSLTVIGVTGSFGKSSTKEAIAAVLSEKYAVLKTSGGVNTKVGIALQILKSLNKSYQYYVVEMGAYRKGEIRDMVLITRPTIGVLTGINEQHVALFGGINKTIEAKFELPEGLPADGIAVINSANRNVNDNKNRIKCKVIEYSSTKPDDNDNAARAVGRVLGLSEAQIELGLQRVQELYGRLRQHENHEGLLLIDDTYSSNTDGFRTSVDLLSQSDRTNKIMVTTGVYELGVDEESINRELSDYANSCGITTFIVEPLHFKYFANAKRAEDAKQLAQMILGLPPKDTIVLLEGRHRINSVLLKELMSVKKS